METNLNQGNGGQEETQGIEKIDENFEPNKLVELNSLVENQKKMIAGETRKNSELQKIVEEQKQKLNELQQAYEEKLSSSEKLKYEEQKRLSELENLTSEVQNLRKINQQRELKELKLQVLQDNDLQNPNILKFVGGESIDDFTENLKLFLEDKRKDNEKIKLNLVNGKAPMSGQAVEKGEKTMTRQEYENIHESLRGKYIKEGWQIID